VRYPRVLAVMLIGSLATGGCGRNAPFPMAQVQGTVKYEDGSLIPADEIQIVFEPQDKERVNGVAPAAAQGHVDVSNGTFEELTTWKYGDGAIIGRHKVTLMSAKRDERGLPQTTKAVPRKYHSAATTPLEVEVSRRKNDFTLEVAKP
jgi:hypothetical protein